MAIARSAASDEPECTIRIRNALDVASTLPRSAWLIRPYLERDSIAILYGDYGTYKSFVALDWAMRVALGLPALGHRWPAHRGDVVFISAEGRGLSQRLRGWCMRHMPDEDYTRVLARAQLYCVEHAVNLSDPVSALALIQQIEALGIQPVFVIADTMSRNSDGSIENSTADAAAYLAIIDQRLRARYKCAVLLPHHVGHTEKGRIRGPIVLAANTDTLIRIERPDAQQRVATLTIERAKDSEPSAPQGICADIVEIGESDEDGQPITTLALSVTDAPVSPEPRRRLPTGRNQQLLLGAMREHSRAQQTETISTLDLRAIAKAQGLSDRRRFSEARESLERDGWIAPCVGGYRLQSEVL